MKNRDLYLMALFILLLWLLSRSRKPIEQVTSTINYDL